MTQAYPLQWPMGWPRTAPAERIDGKHRFKRGDWRGGYKFLSMHEATALLAAEVERIGATPGSLIVSSNVALRLDGMPRSGQRTPDDPGVAVYFDRGGHPVEMARDAFLRPEDNVRSLTLAIEGLRTMERHGGAVMVERAFKGFTALPSPEMAGDAPDKAWWVVLGVEQTCTRDEAHAAFRAAVREAGGTTVELNAAWAAAQEEKNDV
jgi:hypothetical protein